MKYGKVLFGVFALCETSGHGRNLKIFQKKKTIELSMSPDEKIFIKYFIEYTIYNIQKFSENWQSESVGFIKKNPLQDLKYAPEEYISCECNTRVQTNAKNMTIEWGGENVHSCVYPTWVKN